MSLLDRRLSRNERAIYTESGPMLRTIAGCCICSTPSMTGLSPSAIPRRGVLTYNIGSYQPILVHYGCDHHRRARSSTPHLGCPTLTSNSGSDSKHTRPSWSPTVIRFVPPRTMPFAVRMAERSQASEHHGSGDHNVFRKSLGKSCEVIGLFRRTL